MTHLNQEMTDFGDVTTFNLKVHHWLGKYANIQSFLQTGHFTRKHLTELH